MNFNNQLDFNHKSVLLNECIEGLNIRSGGIYADCTAGGGGHSIEIARALDNTGTLLVIDRDMNAILKCREVLKDYKNIVTVRDNFNNITEVLDEAGISGIDGFLLDLGVSSHQLDHGERGFSYMHEARLDMRMDTSQDINAYDIINKYDEKRLKTLIYEYGEEKWAGRIASRIIFTRSDKPIETTSELAEIIKAAIPAAARREGPHPAKRTFQAIRIEVNNELKSLSTVETMIAKLNSGGRICIITFHSLEDRIIKNIFKKLVNPCDCPPGFPICVCGKKPVVRHITKKPIIPGSVELEDNPRARSAKLRIVEKI